MYNKRILHILENVWNSAMHNAEPENADPLMSFLSVLKQGIRIYF